MNIFSYYSRVKYFCLSEQKPSGAFWPSNLTTHCIYREVLETKHTSKATERNKNTQN